MESSTATVSPSVRATRRNLSLIINAGTFSILNDNTDWIIGDYFLSNMYMEFDYDQNKVRLAYGQ